MDINKFFQIEYSYVTGKRKLIFIFATGFFLFLFFLFFQPFGVNNYKPSEDIDSTFLLGISIFSLSLIALMSINELIVYRLPKVLDYKVNLIYWLVWSCIFNGSGLFLVYNFLGGWHDFSFLSYLDFLKNVSVLYILIFFSIYFIFRNIDLGKNLETQYNHPNSEREKFEILNFNADNGKSQFTLKLDALLYLKADDNYVWVYYLRSNKLEKELIRSSLKALEEQISEPDLIRCHRSYIINIMHLNSIKRKSGQLKLHLNFVDKPIPVSDSFEQHILGFVNPTHPK